MIVALVALGFFFSVAGAQEFAPGEPSVVMECVFNGKASDSCQFSCGTELAQGGGKETVNWGNVSRVEMYRRQYEPHSWVFVKFKAGISSPSAVVGLYASSIVHCHGFIDAKEVQGPVLKITRF
jgi:hypothetical protein